MASIFRTVGVALIGAFALPLAVITSFIALALLLILIFSSELRSFGLFVFFAIVSTICYLTFRALQSIDKRGRTLIEKINVSENLKLNPQNKLGYPSPAFIAFDKENRKLAVCNSVTGDYKIQDFEYVLEWYYEWGTGTRMNVGVTGGAFIPGTNMREPTITHSEYKKNFTLVLEVADENNPFLKFPLHAEATAKRWCATLNAIFNG